MTVDLRGFLAPASLTSPDVSPGITSCAAASLLELTLAVSVFHGPASKSMQILEQMLSDTHVC
ncbi:hypothetical protein V513_02320 [Mesotoga sp. H07.pep.5.3]|nr:hypothetical protein V513_02320 [Mesotoga sp. H07.pep.5.3]